MSPSNNNSSSRGGGGGGGRRSSSTSIHITALDGIVNVNSLFTLAVFLGLASSPRDPTRDFAGQCSPPNNKIAEDMVTFDVLSFSSFLFSSLVALCLKQAVRIRCGSHGDCSIDDDEDNHHHYRHHTHGRLFRNVFMEGKVFPSVHKVNKFLFRAGILASALGSLSGCGFLMLALVNLVQIKLGTLGCSAYTTAAVVPLVILVPTALLVYISIIFDAFIHFRVSSSAPTYVVLNLGYSYSYVMFFFADGCPALQHQVNQI